MYNSYYNSTVCAIPLKRVHSHVTNLNSQNHMRVNGNFDDGTQVVIRVAQPSCSDECLSDNKSQVISITLVSALNICPKSFSLILKSGYFQR